MQQTKKKLPSLQNKSFLEQIRSVSSGTSKSLKEDVVKGGARTAWSQFWGVEGESFEQAPTLEKAERKEIQKGAAYEVKQEIILFTASERAAIREIEEIRRELIAIIKTVKEVDFEVQKTVMEIPSKPGVYHVRFLERIKIVLKLIRERLEDSRTWLKLSVSKKKQRGYWSMYKKSGTSFGLSGERVVSTQTG